MSVMESGVEVDPIICDKLSYTVKISEENKPIIKNRIEQLAENNYAKIVFKGSYYKSINLLLGDFNEYKVLIQIEPKLQNTSYIRVEYNPSKLGVYNLEFKKYMDDLFKGIGGYTYILENAICTRFDATVDIHNININNLLFSYKRKAISKAYYKSGKINNYKDHLITTYYLGNDSGKSQVCIYDKILKMKKDKNDNPLLYIEIPDHDITRVEIRCKNRLPLIDTMKVKNQFKPMAAVLLKKANKIKDWRVNMIMRLSCHEGFNNALLAIPNDHRAKFRDLIIEEATPYWWNPDKIWNDWPKTMEVVLF